VQAKPLREACGSSAGAAIVSYIASHCYRGRHHSISQLFVWSNCQLFVWRLHRRAVPQANPNEAMVRRGKSAAWRRGGWVRRSWVDSTTIR